MADPLPVPPTPSGDRDRPRRLTCGFCESVLSLRGDVIRPSTEAKRLGALDDELAAKAKEIERLTAEIQRLTSELASRDTPSRTKEGWED